MNAELQTEMNEPILDRYDAENAAALCGFAAAAYGGGEPIWSSRPNASDTSASIFQAGGDLVLAFRGTRSLANFVTDVRARRVAFTAAPGGPPASVILTRGSAAASPYQGGSATGELEAHEGFLAALDAIYGEAREALADVRGTKGGRIWLTGHSLGGALAKLFALRAALERRRPDGVYTFGEPRVGNAALRDCYDALLKGRTFRVVDGEDLVTRLPWLLGAYRHCGTEIFYDSLGRARVEPCWAVKGFSDVFGAWREWSREGRLALLADHHIGRYLELYGSRGKWTAWTAWTADGTGATKGTNQNRLKAELQTLNREKAELQTD